MNCQFFILSCYIILGMISCVLPFFLQPYWLGFIFVALYCIIPVFVFYISFIIKIIYYKNKPVLSIYSNWFVEGTLCPKCQTGKIKYSLFRDGTSYCCCCFFWYLKTKTYFICFDCKTVYPETYLDKFIPKYPPWSPEPYDSMTT